MLTQRIVLLLAAAWTGTLWTIGYVVAPTLFATLDDRRLAGTIAGTLFRIEGIVSVVAGVLLLALANSLVQRARSRGGRALYRSLRWPLLGMVLCTLIGYFALDPFMAMLREKAAAEGLAVGASRHATQFGILHGVSSLFYLVESLLGVLLIWRLAGRGR